MRSFYPLLPFAVALVVAGAARAEGLSVQLNHSARLDVRGASSVVVGNPKVADVTVVDSHTVFVSGRGYGTSDIIVTGQDGRTLFDGDVTVVPAHASISVYRGVKRSEASCAGSCTEADQGGGASAPPAQP